MNIQLASRLALAAVKTVLLAVFVLGTTSPAIAANAGGGFHPPDQAGPYSIGHTTVILTDPSRDQDGSAPPTTPGRFLYLDIWYPTTVESGGHITYTWNNPLYNDNPGGLVYPGLPDLAPLTSAGSRSLNPVLDDAPLPSSGRFPLLVASHGNLVASAKNMPDTLETLASHGYVVASVEHSGNNDAWYQADWLGRRLGLPIGPNPGIAANGTILQRSKDVSFVIDAVLGGAVDNETGLAFSQRIDADSIGVLGYSLGGMTSLATVTGIGSANYPADRRVKAAFMGAGTNYGLLLDAEDYANARVPLMFFGNDTGIAYDNFNRFSGSRSKYLVDIGDYNHHIGGYESSWCQDFKNAMEVVDPAAFPGIFFAAGAYDPSVVADYIFPATFYWIYTGTRNSGVYDYCEPSVFDNISDEQLIAVLFGNPDILAVRDELIGSMPLKPEASIAEITRLTNWYAVSFFNKYLRNENAYSQYLNDSMRNQRRNPLVRLVRDCQKEQPNPLDLLPGDRITFTPVGDSGYDVSVTSGASLHERGTQMLAIAGGGGVETLNFPGFSFPVPGLRAPIENLIVSENGVITTRTSSDIGDIDDQGSPWYMKGHMLLGAQFVIGALMKDLDVGATAAVDGVYGYFDAANERVVVTYSGMPSAGTASTNTLQVAVYRSGTIELTIGELGATGPAYAPGILGTIGIAGGRTRVRDLGRVEPVDFSALRDRGTVFVPFGGEDAIFEQFFGGTGRSCHGRG